MKKILFYALLGSLFFMQGCSSDDGFWEDVAVEKSNFPKESEELGKAVAKEIRAIVSSFNQLGVDYSNFNDPKELRNQFYKDYDRASPTLTRSGTSINQYQISPEEFYQEYNNLTEIQLEFFTRIDKEYAESSSCQDFLKRLAAINDDIYLSVPKIEQERLFNTTAILYYGLAEINKLEEQGQMFLTPYNGIQSPRVRSGSESGGGGSFWGSCREILSSISVPIGSIWAGTGEVVSAVAWRAAGVFAIILCFSGDTDFGSKCRKLYSDCIDRGGPNSYPNSGGWGQTKCQSCYDLCIGSRGSTWDCY